MNFSKFIQLILTLTLFYSCGENVTLVGNSDEISKLKEGTALQFDVSVDDGTGSGNYKAGDEVTIIAKSIPGKKFIKWIGNDEDLKLIENLEKNNKNTFIMPRRIVSLKALYENLYNLVVVDGEGSGSYINTDQVNIKAKEDTKRSIFLKWEASSKDLGLIDLNTRNQSFEMPNRDVEIKAIYNSKYELKVSDGSGSGYYSRGEKVSITAKQPIGLGTTFSHWQGTDEDLKLIQPAANNQEISYIMPDRDVSLAAVYSALYGVTVSGGIGSGSYKAGTTVVISAEKEKGEMLFSHFTGSENDLALLKDSSLNEHKIIMPPRDLSYSAVYINKTYNAKIENAKGSGVYKKGDIVEIIAPEQIDEKIFAGYKGSAEDLALLGDSRLWQQRFQMPGRDINLIATYKDKEYSVKVSGASGTGSYKYNDTVKISALEESNGKIFSHYEGLTEDLEILNDIKSANNTFKMPKRDLFFKAIYIDKYYELVVDNGLGSGQYPADKKIVIGALEFKEGKVFSHYDGSPEDLKLLGDPSNKTHELLMPTKNVSFKAIYKDITYKLSVKNAEGSGEYAEGASVKLIAPEKLDGQKFLRYEGEAQDLELLENANKKVQEFKMPGREVSFTAVYTDIGYEAVVKNGEGSGVYQVGESVILSAPEKNEAGHLFSKWLADDENLKLLGSSVEDRLVSFKMPAYNVLFTASYEEPVDPPIEIAYCGDGIVNQDWEQCDGSDDCSEKCLKAGESQCSSLSLARVVIENTKNLGQGDIGKNIYLDSVSNRLPNGTWFALEYNENKIGSSSTQSRPLENDELPGIGIERSKEGQIRVLLNTTLKSSDLEMVSGRIEFFRTTVKGIESDSGDNKLENGFDGVIGDTNQDEVSHSDSEVKFHLSANTKDDAFFIDWAGFGICEEKLTANDIAKKCDDIIFKNLGVKKYIDSYLEFPNRSQTCSFGKNGNGPRINDKHQAQEVEYRYLDIPENAVVCKFQISAVQNKDLLAERATVHYDDNLYFTINDKLIVGTDKRVLGKLSQSDQNLYDYDFSKIIGVPSAIGYSGKYCLVGDQNCAFAGHDQRGDFSLTLLPEDAKYLSASIMNSKASQLKFGLHVVGDNDNGDCRYSGFNYIKTRVYYFER